MNNLILGYTWDDIKAMQQGTFTRPLISNTPKAQATESDIQMLLDFGIDNLILKGFHGVIDRLQTSGYIKSRI